MSIETGQCDNCHHGAIIYPLVITREGEKELVKTCLSCKLALLQYAKDNGRA